MEMVPSCAFAAQISLPSGETSKPSAPLPTATTVSSQSARGGPPGPPPPGPGTRTAPAAHALLDQGHGGRTNIGGNDALQVFRNKNHVGSVLARAEHPIDLLNRRIIAADRLGSFRGEPDLAAGVD